MFRMIIVETDPDSFRLMERSIEQLDLERQICLLDGLYKDYIVSLVDPSKVQFLVITCRDREYDDSVINFVTEITEEFPNLACLGLSRFRAPIEPFHQWVDLFRIEGNFHFTKELIGKFKEDIQEIERLLVI